MRTISRTRSSGGSGKSAGADTPASHSFRTEQERLIPGALLACRRRRMLLRLVRQPSASRGSRTGYRGTHHRFVALTEREDGSLPRWICRLLRVAACDPRTTTDRIAPSSTTSVDERSPRRTIVPLFEMLSAASEARRRELPRLLDSSAGCIWTRRSSESARDLADDESRKSQTTDQNPQRPYAEHPGHRVKIWSLCMATCRDDRCKG